MKRIVQTSVLFLFIVALAAIPAGAQSFVGAGASVTRSSSYDPSPLTRKDGGSVYPGGYVEAGFALPHNLQARALVEYQPEATLRSVFTSDADTGRVAEKEVRFRAGARYTFESDRPVDAFVEAGVDGFKQFFKKTRPEPMPGPVPAYAHDEYEENYAEPSASANPYITFGVRIGEYTEAGFSRLFEGALNDARLSGYRVNAAYQHPVFGPVSVKIGAEADYLTYRDTAPGYIAEYFKRDTAFRFRVGLIIGGER